MSFCKLGLDENVHSCTITTEIADSRPMMKLANELDWGFLAELALPDLKKTTRKGFWHLGRRLFLRVHLGMFLLQSLRNETDRQIEETVSQTPELQVFCGKSLGSLRRVWKCPDHTAVEKFRNRLDAGTSKTMGDYVVQKAIKLGFASVEWFDIDSTVQEANIAYPSDASLMQKMAEKVYHVMEHIQDKMGSVISQPRERLVVAIESIRKKAHGYFFLARNAAIDVRRNHFASYHAFVQEQITPCLEYLKVLPSAELQALPWNIRRAAEQIMQHGRCYLDDVAHFVKTHTIKAGKILSWHAQFVACIRKGKAGKEYEFGRVFQLARVKGNFMLALGCTSIRMADKQSLVPAAQELRALFGPTAVQSVGTDKGYYSHKGVKELGRLGINTDGVQRSANVKNQVDPAVAMPLRNRRAGIEPLIAHVKKFGLGKSRYKSDAATLQSGYRAVMGFNLHQLKRQLAKAA